MRTLMLLIGCSLVLAGCAGAPPAVGSQRGREVVGPSISTTIVEDFDHGPPEVPLEQRVDFWGDRITGTSGRVDLVDAGAEGAGRAARFSFEASFDRPYSPDAWRGTGLGFVGWTDLEAPGEAAHGITFRLRVDAATQVNVFFGQRQAGQDRSWYLPIHVEDGAWQEWRIPFRALTRAEDDATVDPSRPVRFVLEVPYHANWRAWRFRDGPGTAVRVAWLVDDIGWWRSTAVDVPGSLETFDDGRDRMPFTVDLYGSSEWTDYSTSDGGETRINGGVTGQDLRLALQPGGPEGAFLEVQGRLELNPAIRSFHEAWQVLTVTCSAPLSLPVAGATSLSFLVRSDVVVKGGIEVQDESRDRHFGTDFPVLRDWTRVRVPFERLMAETLSLATTGIAAPVARLQLAFELPREVVEAAAAGGVLAFTIGLDDFRLE